jgi:predicted Rdx family selenoprotein
VIVSRGGQVNVRVEDVQTWQRARGGVDGARRALEKTGK